MKGKYFVLSLLLFWSAGASAQSEQTRLEDQQMQDCMRLLEIAELKEADWIYPQCGFDNETIAWYTWAPQVSKAEYPKALYQLCMRHPDNDYSALYCQKSADLGYLPAMLQHARKMRQDGKTEAYVQALSDIIAQHPLQEQFVIETAEDKAAVEAYAELGAVYFQGELVPQNLELALQYLKKAADLDYAKAAHALGIALYWGGDKQTLPMATLYWWKAMLLGCPAAEENLGYLGLYTQGRLRESDAQYLMEKRMFTCDASQTTGPRAHIKTAQECDCAGTLAWIRSQESKPYTLLSISDKQAVLSEANGKTEKVSEGDMTQAGYLVDEIRPTAVIVKKSRERHVLLLKPDEDCIELCQNPNLIPTRYINDIEPSRLTFTQTDCLQLARSLENLNDITRSVNGMTQCRLQDWKTWGQGAVNEKRNKHLYLLGNIQASSYLPAFVDQAEQLYDPANRRQMEIVEKMLTFVMQQKPIDTLSALKKEQAYCIQTALHMQEPYYDPKQAFTWAEAGAKEGYPQQMNMLGILYARGEGVVANEGLAAEWFTKAMDASSRPFMDAMFNYNLLQTGENFDQFRYGRCKEIVEPSVPSVSDLIEVYPL